jgi:hypothetical protein
MPARRSNELGLAPVSTGTKVEAGKAAIPEGDHVFTFEFTPTSKADPLKGRARRPTSS